MEPPLTGASVESSAPVGSCSSSMTGALPVGAGLGFMLAMVLFAGVRERLESADIPEGLKGLPITLVAAALVSLSFVGFQGLFGL